MKLKFYLWSLLTMFAVSMAAVGCSDSDDDVVTPTEPDRLTFELSVNNVTANSADLKVVPSNNDRYYAACLPTEDIQGLGEDAVVAQIMSGVKDADLMSGTQEIKASNLKALTSYSLVAFGYENGKATTKIKKEKFMTKQAEDTDPEQGEGPEVKVSAAYDAENDECVFTTQCLSQDAVSARWLAMPAGIMDEEIASGRGDLDSFFAKDGKDFEESMIGLMNDEGAVVRMGSEAGVKKGEKMAFVARVKNEQGMTEQRADVVYGEENVNPDPQPDQPTDGAPEVTLFGKFNDKTATIDFTMTCVSKNAEKCGYFATPAEALERELKNGKTIEEFVQMWGGFNPMDPSDLASINSEGLTIAMGVTEGIKAGMVGTFLLQAENAKGKTLKRADAQLENTIPNAGPDVVLTGHGNAASIWFLAKAFSKDAQTGAMGVFEKSKIDDILNAGGTLTSIVQGNEDNAKMFRKFDKYAIEMLNLQNDDKGLKLQIDGAQPDVVYSAILFVDNANGRTIKRANAQVDTSKSSIIEMTESMFLENIWNYEIEPTFTYRGERASVIDFYATWCGNCTAMKPLYAKMAKEFAGRVDFYNCDVETTGYVHQRMATAIGVDGSIPLFVFISKEGNVDYIMGRTTESAFYAKLSKIAGEAKNPEVTLTGEWNADKSIVEFFLQCTSQDARFVTWLINDTYAIDNFIKDNNMTMESFIEINGQPMEGEYLAAFNGPGIKNGVNCKPGYSVTCLLDVQNIGGRTIKRSDVAAPGKSMIRSMEAVSFKTNKAQVSKVTMGRVFRLSIQNADELR